MPYTTKRKKQIVYALSLGLGFGIGLYGLWTLLFYNARLGDYIIGAAIIAGLLPYSVLNFLENRWKRSIDMRIPELLEDIAEGQMTGLTFLRAIEASATKNYGAVTDELKRILAHVRLGGTIEEGFMRFAERVGSRMVRRASGIMVETTRAGGDIARIIRSLAAYMRQIEEINLERRSTMKVYIYIVYIAFGVFVATVIILLNQFFWPMVGFGQTIFSPQADYETYRRIFYYMAMIQGVFGGMVAGKLGEGYIASGLKHAIIMVLATILIFVSIIVG